MLSIKRGYVVRSTAGRDKQRLLAVIECKGATVVLADGRKRPIERPKTKSIKHISLTASVLNETQLASNCGLRKALNALQHSAKR